MTKPKTRKDKATPHGPKVNARKRQKLPKAPPRKKARTTPAWIAEERGPNFANDLAVLDVFEDWRRAKARWGAINDFLALATVTRDERAAARKLARQLCKAMLVGIGPLREHFRTTWEKGLAAARVRRMRDYVRYGGTDEYGEPLLDPRRLEPAARALHVDPDDIEAAVLMRRDKIKPYVIWHEIVGAVSGPVGVRAVEARAADAPVGLDAFFDSIVDDDDGGLFFDDERKKLRRFEWPKK